jgi:hypothetical protein
MPKWVGAMSRRKEGRVGSGQHVKRLAAAVGFGSDAQGGRSGGIPGQMRRNRRGTDSRAGEMDTFCKSANFQSGPFKCISTVR